MLKLKCSKMITSNWKIIFGNGFDALVSTDFAEQPKTNLDDITSAERTILLARHESPILIPSAIDASCHIRIDGQSMDYSTRQLTLVCDCKRIEVFVGVYEEYWCTVDGELLDEFDGTKSYLFEITPTQPVGRILLKFISGDIEQIFIYGMHITLMALHSKGVDLFKPSIDLKNVESMLTNATLSDSAEKCKQFIRMHMEGGAVAGPPNIVQLMSFVNRQIDEKLTGNNVPITTTEQDEEDRPMANKQKLPFGLEHSVDTIKTYFDAKLNELEQRITDKMEERLVAMEQRQNEQFGRIFELLTSQR